MKKSIGHTIGAGSDAGQVWFLALSGALVIPAALLLTLRWLGRAGADAVSPGRTAGAPGPRVESPSATGPMG